MLRVATFVKLDCAFSGFRALLYTNSRVDVASIGVFIRFVVFLMLHVLPIDFNTIFYRLDIEYCHMNGQSR